MHLQTAVLLRVISCIGYQCQYSTHVAPNGNSPLTISCVPQSSFNQQCQTTSSRNKQPITNKTALAIIAEINLLIRQHLVSECVWAVDGAQRNRYRAFFSSIHWALAFCLRSHFSRPTIIFLAMIDESRQLGMRRVICNWKA